MAEVLPCHLLKHKAKQFKVKHKTKGTTQGLGWEVREGIQKTFKSRRRKRRSDWESWKAQFPVLLTV